MRLWVLKIDIGGPTIGTGQENGNVQKLCIVGRYHMCLRVKKGSYKIVVRGYVTEKYFVALFYFDIQRESPLLL